MQTGAVSSFGGTAMVIYQTLESYGVDAEAIFNQVGLTLSQAAEPSSRISVKVMLQLLTLTKEATNDPCFGLKFSEYVHPTSYHALGLALLSSSNLRAFCERLDRYFSFVSTGEVVEFRESEGRACLEIQPADAVRDTEVCRYFLDGTMAFIIKLVRLMYRPDFAPQQIELMWTVPEEEEKRYRDFYKAPISFAAPKSVLWFDPVDLEKPLPAANTQMALQNDQVVQEYLERMNRTDLVSQVRAKLIELLPSGDCSREKVAKTLHMSARALHNRLEEAGTNYQETLDSTRKELAQQYMNQPALTVSEIGYLLGFSDCSNFSRAFKNWTGKSPKAYRADLAAK